MNWAWAAIIASILWGACYAISDLLIKKYSIPYVTIFLFQGAIHFIIITCIALYFTYTGVDITTNLGYTALFILIFDCLLGASASLLTYFAISQKNAVLTGFIEISYPFFTMLISLIIMSKLTFNWLHIIGGILIFIGSGIVMIGG